MPAGPGRRAGRVFAHMSVLLLVLLTGNWEQDLYEDIRFGWKGPVQDAVADALDLGLDWPTVAALDAGLLVAGDERLSATALQAGASLVGASAVLFATRAIVNRPRPDKGETEWYRSAFPSGHATTFFSTAAVYAWRYPKLRWPLAGLGVLVGLSRIYLGEHQPTDVLAGAALGIGAGALTLAVWPEHEPSWDKVFGLSAPNSGVGLGVRLRF
jgi:membrane-associated phospholipid phosphatase